MSIRIVPPSTAKGRLELQQAVASLRQQGREVGSFAQFFWTMARGLEYPDSTLKEAFNLCLDDPLPQWEMEQLRGIDYWTFSKYLHHRKDWQILTPPESACRDHATLPLMSSQIQDPLQSPTLKRRLRRKRAAKSAVSVSESTELTAASEEAITAEDPRSVPVIHESVQSSPVSPEPVKSDYFIPEMAKLSAITSNVFKSNIVNSEAATAAAVTPVAVDHTLLCHQKPTRRRARVVQFDNPSQGVPSPLVQEGLNQEIPGTLVWVNLSQEAPSPVVQVDSIQDALPPEVSEDQTQMVSSPVVQVDPSQEAQGPMVQEESTLMFQFPVVPEVYNLVKPHPKLPNSPVVSALVKESVTVRITLPEPPDNPVTPKKGSHVSRAMSSEPALVPNSEACPEHPNLPATAKKAISVLPTSHVMITERDAVCQFVFSETVPASVTDACPERSNPPAMAMEAVSEQSAHLVTTIEAVVKQPTPNVLATKVRFKHPGLPAIVMEAIPEQPAVITTQANTEQPVLSATAPAQKPPVSDPAPVLVPPERPPVATPQSSPVSVLAVQEDPSESRSVSVPEALESASKSVPELVLSSPDPVSQECTIPASAVMAPEFVPRSFNSQELAPKTTKAIFKTPPVKQAHVSRRTTNKVPIPPSLLPRPYEFAKPVPPWSATNYFPGVFSSLPVPPPLFPGCPGTQGFRPSPPSQLVPPLTPLPNLDAWRRPLGGGYCQEPALTVLSVLFLFNVSLFVLCLSTWLCLCLCLPCPPLVPPPCFPWSRPLV